MTLVLLDIPNDPAAWPEWLERQIVGLDLADLVSQLQLVVAPAAGSNIQLAEVCGGQLTATLQQGLKTLSAEQVRTLLKNPHLLLELQDQVLTEGGRYWRDLPLSLTHSSRVAIQRDRLTQAIAGAPQISPLKSPAAPAGEKRAVNSRIRQFATAAMVLLAVTAIWFSQNPAAPGWGFQKSGLLTAKVSDKEYLNSLADAAQGWFNKRPATVDDMVVRLEQFKQGCDTLLQAKHPQLNDTDRAWLLERCAVWKGKIEAHVADLKGGGKNLEQVRQESDATVNALIKALHTRATA